MNKNTLNRNHSPDTYKTKGSVIAIGNFDGFHRGHQKIIQRLKQIARENNLKFRYEAVTNLYNHGKDLAKKRSLYRQQYCGCVFSEYERYKK